MSCLSTQWSKRPHQSGHEQFVSKRQYGGWAGEGWTTGAEGTFKIGQVQHTGLVHPVVLATLKEGVIQVGQVGDNSLALGLAQQHVVPLTQPVTTGRLLPVWVAVQDIVIALQ